MPDHPPFSVFRLRRHADFQRVYKASRKQFSRQMSYFYRLREDGETPRIGLTVGKVLSKRAVDRNRIKRRLREAVRRNLGWLRTPVDIVLHPKLNAIDMDFALLESEVAQIFQRIQQSVQRPARPSPGQREGPSR